MHLETFLNKAWQSLLPRYPQRKLKILSGKSLQNDSRECCRNLGPSYLLLFLVANLIGPNNFLLVRYDNELLSYLCRQQNFLKIKLNIYVGSFATLLNLGFCYSKTQEKISLSFRREKLFQLGQKNNGGGQLVPLVSTGHLFPSLVKAGLD